MKQVMFKQWLCDLRFRTYARQRTVAIELTDAREGFPVAMATVNVPGVNLAQDEVIIKDYAENAGMLQTLSDAGIVRATGRVVTLGYVNAPICKLLVQPA